jgi:guanylate kinase
MIRRGLCLVIAAPSGCGKTTIMERLLAEDQGLVRSISATTRAPRSNEAEGIHYYFKTQADFDGLVATGGMLEHATVFGRSYGIPREPVDDALARGLDVTFVIDWQGYHTLRARLPGDVVGIFLLPPSLSVLESRLRRRGDGMDLIASRMAEADAELAHATEFDHRVTNDDLETALADVRDILAAARGVRLSMAGTRVA